MRKVWYLILISSLLLSLSFQGEARLRFTAIYEVREGDTLEGIANKFGVTIQELLRVNNLNERNIIRIDDELIIPYITKEEIPVFQSTILSPPPKELIYNLGEVNYPIRIQKRSPSDEINFDEIIHYRVQPGDNLYDLARHFNTSINTIRVLNKIEGNLINIGQRLVIPTYNLTPRQAFGRTVTPAEVDLLARAINGEARGEPLLGQVAVGAVIINRLLSPFFPNTLSGVIYQPRQFSAVCDGQINLHPTPSSYVAARRALDGEDPTMGALYFYNPRTAVNVAFFERVTKVIEIGNHVFGY